MKVSIRNLSNKKRSKKAMEELKEYACFIAKELKIEKNIREINLKYKKNWSGYYKKGKPLVGFTKSFNHGVVQIDLTGFWDVNQATRKEAIVHELTHAKQLIEKRLQISSNFKELKWNGVKFDKWKKWNNEKFQELSEKAFMKKRFKLMPWEREVENNLEKFL